MFEIRRVSVIILRGLVVGALLGYFAPAAAVGARDDEGCKCDDNGTGKYACNYEQTKCIAGAETCNTICSDPDLN